MPWSFEARDLCCGGPRGDAFLRTAKDSGTFCNCQFSWRKLFDLEYALHTALLLFQRVTI